MQLKGRSMPLERRRSMSFKTSLTNKSTLNVPLILHTRTEPQVETQTCTHTHTRTADPRPSILNSSTVYIHWTIMEVRSVSSSLILTHTQRYLKARDSSWCAQLHPANKPPVSLVERLQSDHTRARNRMAKGSGPSPVSPAWALPLHSRHTTSTAPKPAATHSTVSHSTYPDLLHLP